LERDGLVAEEKTIMFRKIRNYFLIMRARWSWMTGRCRPLGFWKYKVDFSGKEPDMIMYSGFCKKCGKLYTMNVEEPFTCQCGYDFPEVKEMGQLVKLNKGVKE
jgi:hypothetical protein